MPDPTDVDLSELPSFQINMDSSFYKDNKQDNLTSDLADNNGAYQLFEFDPNTLDQTGWEKLGFSEKQANSILNYRSKYGPFNEPEDVEKIFVISEDKYEEIKPYMIFDNQVLREGWTDNGKENDLHLRPMEINSATQEELETIHGIGPTFAKRTIKYRDILGGYVSKEQFKEIYGITDDAIEALSSAVEIDLDHVNKIQINSDSKDKMRKHPYLKDWDVITAIIAERDKHNVEDLQFLVDQGLMDRMEVDKLIPYIQF